MGGKLKNVKKCSIGQKVGHHGAKLDKLSVEIVWNDAISKVASNIETNMCLEKSLLCPKLKYLQPKIDTFFEHSDTKSDQLSPFIPSIVTTKKDNIDDIGMNMKILIMLVQIFMKIQ